MRKIATAMLAALTAGAAATAGMASANAYVVNGGGSYTVTADEVRAAFGPGVDLAGVEFGVEGGNQFYSVTCTKTVGKKAKVLTHDFRRPATATWTVDDTFTTTDGVVTGFAVTSSASYSTSKVKCPKPFTQVGSPTLLRTQDVELYATYNGVEVELMESVS